MRNDVMSSQHQQNDSDELLVRKPLNIGQWVCVGALYVILLLLVSFIIYISSTWNKDRVNEYT